MGLISAPDWPDALTKADFVHVYGAQSERVAKIWRAGGSQFYCRFPHRSGFDDVAGDIATITTALSTYMGRPEKSIGSTVSLFINQGDRPAVVLAYDLDRRLALVEYEMPAGTTGLRIIPLDAAGRLKDGGRAASYRTLPIGWLRRLVDTDMDWIGDPQTKPSNRDAIGSPMDELRRRRM